MRWKGLDLSSYFQPVLQSCGVWELSYEQNVEKFLKNFSDFPYWSISLGLRTPSWLRSELGGLIAAPRWLHGCSYDAPGWFTFAPRQLRGYFTTALRWFHVCFAMELCSIFVGFVSLSCKIYNKWWHYMDYRLVTLNLTNWGLSIFFHYTAYWNVSWSTLC